MEYDKVAGRLFLGSFPGTADDVDALAREGVTAVLNVQSDEDFAQFGIDWAALEASYRHSGIHARREPIRDFDDDDLRRRLPGAAEALRDLMDAGHTVYVHCTAGMNRSPSTVIGYLHWHEGWNLVDAESHVRQCRPCVPGMDVIRLASEDRRRRPST